jgi:elongation factor G
MDFMPQEKERGITISSAAITCTWKDHIVNIIDTPGHVDFSIEVELATRVLDGCVVLVDAVSGVQCQTKSVWRRLAAAQLPAIAFVNKMDRIGASLDAAIQSMQTQLQIQCVALQMPLFERDSATYDDRFVGFVDLISGARFVWPAEALTGPTSVALSQQPTVSLVMENDSEYSEMKRRREELFEALASVDDSFLERYVEYSDGAEQISIHELTAAMRRAVISRKLLAVFCGATLRGIGTHALLDGVCSLLPAPEDLPINAHPQLGKTSITDAMECGLLIFKLSQQHHSGGGASKGLVAYARVFAGELTSGTVLKNLRSQLDERVMTVAQADADSLALLQRPAISGEVVCLSGLRNCQAGDLLLSRKAAIQLQKSSANIQRNGWLQRASVSVPPPVFALSLEPDSATQLQQLERALAVLLQEDPSLQLTRDAESGQLVLRGLGELHLEVALDKLRRQHRVAVSSGRTYVACRETLLLDRDLSADTLLTPFFNGSRKDSSDIQQTGNDVDAEATKRIEHHAHYERVLEGGKRLFAAFDLVIEPSTLSELTSPATFAVSQTVLDTLAVAERDAVTDTLQRCFERGPRGFPVTGLRVSVVGVERDAMCTTPGAVRACLSSALHSILSSNNNENGRGDVRGEYDSNVLLEPVMRIEVSVPQGHLGTVVSDLTSKRNALHIQLRDTSTPGDSSGSSSSTTEDAVVECVAPLSAILGYATILRSLTKGEGSFSAEYLTHLPTVSSHDRGYP